jgi:hypothetical protein
VKQKAIELERKNAQSPEAITNFFQKYEKVCSDFQISKDNFYNYDEMGIRISYGRGK